MPLVLALGCLAGCPEQPGTTLPEPPPPVAQVPADYWVEAEGTVKLGPMTVPGALRMQYVVYPDGRVAVPTFGAWMDDLDLVVKFLWWEVETEPLRCTGFRNVEALAGTLSGSVLTVPAGAELIGSSAFTRNADGECPDKARRMEIKTPTVMVATHDPDNDHFALQATFVTGEPPQQVNVQIDVEGSYLNRPPTAVIQAHGDGVDVGEDGCPLTRKEGRMVLANTPEGLLVHLRSDSWDPDGTWPENYNPKLPRLDLEFEQWARHSGEGYEFLGSAREIGPILFENDREHQLLLWVTDRRGAEGRKVCTFRVQKL